MIYDPHPKKGSSFKATMNFIHFLDTVIFYEVLITHYLAEQNNTAQNDTKMFKTSALLKVIIQKFT